MGEMLSCGERQELRKNRRGRQWAEGENAAAAEKWEKGRKRLDAAPSEMLGDGKGGNWNGGRGKVHGWGRREAPDRFGLIESVEVREQSGRRT